MDRESTLVLWSWARELAQSGAGLLAAPGLVNCVDIGTGCAMHERACNPAFLSMKLPVLISTFLGWWAAAGTMTLGTFIMERSQPHFDWREVILFNLFWCGFFAVPACLIAGFLVTQYLPVSSQWWRPAQMALLGGICGISVMGVLVGMASAYQNNFSSDGWYLCIFAAAAGAVCGFSLSRFKQKQPKLRASSAIS